MGDSLETAVVLIRASGYLNHCVVTCVTMTNNCGQSLGELPFSRSTICAELKLSKGRHEYLTAVFKSKVYDWKVDGKS